MKMARTNIEWVAQVSFPETQPVMGFADRQ
jgi:hypothetical protein